MFHRPRGSRLSSKQAWRFPPAPRGYVHVFHVQVVVFCPWALVHCSVVLWAGCRILHPLRRWIARGFRVLVLNSSKLFLASDLGFTGIPESGFRGPGLRGLDLGFWVSGGLGPCFAPEAPVVRPRAPRPEADCPEGRLARRRILARRWTFNSRGAI